MSIELTTEKLARQDPIGFARAFGVDLLLPFEQTLAGQVLMALDRQRRRDWGECYWTARDDAA